MPPEMEKGTFALEKELRWWTNDGQQEGRVAVQRMSSQLCFGSLVSMGTRRMKLCTPGGTALSPWGATSQEPFAKLVWHPGPALEQAQNREGC